MPGFYLTRAAKADLKDIGRYKILTDTIEIVRILHDRMDVERHLPDF